MAARLQLVPITVAAAVHLLGTGVACHLPLAMVPGFLAAVWLAWLLSWRLQFLPARSALFVAWGTVAFAWTLMVVHPPAPRDLANILQEPREHITVSGSVAAEPFSRVYQEDAAPVWFVPLEIDRVRRTPQWQRASGRLLLSVRDGDLGEKLAYGDRVTVAGDIHTYIQSQVRVATASLPRTSRETGVSPLLLIYQMHVVEDAAQSGGRGPATSADQPRALEAGPGPRGLQIAARLLPCRLSESPEGSISDDPSSFSPSSCRSPSPFAQELPLPCAARDQTA